MEDCLQMIICGVAGLLLYQGVYFTLTFLKRKQHNMYFFNVILLGRFRAS